ncbi:copper amine oxidase N-terminal domain-containing protein [Pelotomaculum terephthalicicum JT]|uniref:stalk domain-containing protein n=1 Tax=Pelotomaculum TaxID=191373 RepID=UPI0009C59631|nr:MULTISPECIES: stalk domain-containing protein [Pelotomaculum]MCG9969706.1 copper amine oxidase N-terminal domain-containing protein [Pelotomaculum terephthalicicum JT]OPX84941.1 MAG: hypothetical protein A4E54_02671 [Pelotomaculum sp. PtaB.Bin117]OPY61964.1 MAG: hypothetical protein A4E56_01675 [Pelotomaculum sp. PtaU1.Bin065]
MKKRIITVLLSLAIMMMTAMTAEATVAKAPINVDYQDIVIYVNGNAVSVQANEEPFIYDSRTFLPVRALAEALNLNVEWIGEAKAVKISGNTTTDINSLAEKDLEIQNLKLQISQKDSEIQSLNDKIASLESNDDIGSLEDELISDYDYLEDVKIEDISLDGDEDDVDVNIEVDLNDYADEWEYLDDSDIEDWIEDLVGSIQDGLSDYTVVDGEIIDIDSDDVLVEFYKDGDDSLEVDFGDEDYRSDTDAEDVEDDLKGDSYYVSSIEFTVTSVNYDEDDDNVTVKLEAVDDDAATEWEDLTSSTINSKVKDICKDIAETFDEDADISLDTVTIYFYDEDSYSLDNFEYDVDDDDLI